MPTNRVSCKSGASITAAVVLACGVPMALAQAPPAVRAGIDWQRLGTFEIARTETTVGQFRHYVEASRSATRAERQGGGEVYEAAWVKKPGWNWRTPFGPGGAADDAEPAVHITYAEAQAFCAWAGGRLPTDAEWTGAAYTEQRSAPAAPFVRGRSYPYPSGETPEGAQCLADCGTAARTRARAHGARLERGHGHARVTETPAGVNGLHDMGGNVWEWVDEPRGGSDDGEKRTRGGSWWYGAEQMRSDHLQNKPGTTAVVYIGFRCVRALR